MLCGSRTGESCSRSYAEKSGNHIRLSRGLYGICSIFRWNLHIGRGKYRTILRRKYRTVLGRKYNGRFRSGGYGWYGRHGYLFTGEVGGLFLFRTAQMIA